MATPHTVEIRTYQVGFGDCFLVSFIYAKAKKHILIDFGTTALPKFVKGDHMMRVAEHIKKVCEGKLTAVVATHRHRDHISGFARTPSGKGSGAVIAECKPDVVIQPWTEDPKAKTDDKAPTKGGTSRMAFTAGLDAMHRVAEQAAKVGKNPPPTMSRAIAGQLSFIGEDNMKNLSAVRNLMEMGRRKGAKAVFAHHKSRSGLETKLEGVVVTVLGPPTLAQTDKIGSMAKSHPEFWTLLGGSKSVQKMKIAHTDSAGPVPAEARWFRDRIARLSGEQLLEIVRILDDQMNNTSLILLFQVGKKKLLFPGDAQIENWNWALSDSPDHADTQELLKEVDFYKVGHHGSRNATPKNLLWEKFKKRGSGAPRMATILSTMKGKHQGVPRPTLLDALETQTDLCSTQGFKFVDADEPCRTVVIKVPKAR